jgi:hypothetical protein
MTQCDRAFGLGAWTEEWYCNPSCDLLEIYGLLRPNEGWKSVAPGEEEARGRENYSDVLSVNTFANYEKLKEG